uniref:Zgc:193801 n=1 Tax=Paramormyrops kingsleyae TaxID=1676925 RepID=A0A3B3RLQ8_9TELE
MAAFIAHPSVRIKGTEQIYNPVLCQDEKCAARAKGSHMHCPFCNVAEAYQDPVILQAHYRVKHVDKGIDFSGLKVLRCCNHCEIVGTIKGEKKFKGAHWHCYRCRNGFNRRDEAVKHYKTHFRNPHTTFQIQITQEVNNRQYYEQNAEAHPKAYGGLAISPGTNGECCTIGSMLAQTVINTSTSAESLLREVHKDSSVNNGMMVGAEETVGPSQQASGRETLVLMNPSGENDSLVFEETSSIIAEQGGENLEQNLLLERQLLELHQQNQALQQEKDLMEKKLQAEIQQLKDHVGHTNGIRVSVMLRSSPMPGLVGKGDLCCVQVESLEAQHHELLQTQLATLKKEILQQHNGLTVNGHTGEHLGLPVECHGATGALAVSFLNTEPSEEQGGGALTGIELVEVQLGPEQVQPAAKTADLVPATSPVCPAKLAPEQQVVLSPTKRLSDAVHEGEAKNKLARTT